MKDKEPCPLLLKAKEILRAYDPDKDTMCPMSEICVRKRCLLIEAMKAIADEKLKYGKKT